MKRYPQISKVFPELNISTDKEFLKYMESLGVKHLEVNNDDTYQYGWFNKNTKTSFYLISEYYALPSVLFDEDSLKELKNWIESGYPEQGLNNKKWKQICK